MHRIVVTRKRNPSLCVKEVSSWLIATIMHDVILPQPPCYSFLSLRSCYLSDRPREVRNPGRALPSWSSALTLPTPSCNNYHVPGICHPILVLCVSNKEHQNQALQSRAVFFPRSLNLRRSEKFSLLEHFSLWSHNVAKVQNKRKAHNRCWSRFLKCVSDRFVSLSCRSCPCFSLLSSCRQKLIEA